MTHTSHLFTDADNTLWDTNAIYAAAQLALLRGIAAVAGVEQPQEDALAFVRRYDQAIACGHPLGLRYPVEILANSLCTALTGHSIASFSDKDVSDILERYRTQLTQCPVLRPGVAVALREITSMKTAITVVSEGSRASVERTAASHGLMDYISNVVVGTKNQSFYESLIAKSAGSALAACSVGDQLDRDIAPAKYAGLSTAYFPGDFVPAWHDPRLQHNADFIVKSYSEIPAILASIALGRASTGARQQVARKKAVPKK